MGFNEIIMKGEHDRYTDSSFAVKMRKAESSWWIYWCEGLNYDRTSKGDIVRYR